MIRLLDRFRPATATVPRIADGNGDATKVFDGLLRSAVADGASDLHLEPKEDGLLVRVRIDGQMHEQEKIPRAQRDALLARGKIFAGMDITEKRLPQDGRAEWRERGRRIHLRLSTLPTVHGESLVIRLLDQSMPAHNFGELGFTQSQAQELDYALSGPPGLLFLTGPTGSGKTTTLHAALHALDHRGRVVCALEDPVEYEFPPIRQTEIREKIGLTFASCLRALLRQNPDILLVGETRDAETAQLAIRAALTGHLVLSTLHTNDALAAVPRLRDLGVEPFLLAAALRLVAAQRLVRKLCNACKTRREDAVELSQRHQTATAEFCRPVGCAACRASGFRGRLGVYEVIPLRKFLPLIAANAPQAELLALRDAERLPTLWQHGLGLAANGLTSLEEVARVL